MAVETHVLDDDREAITGWGRTAPVLARVRRPRGYAEAVGAVLACGRVRLAQDSRVRPGALAVTHPRLDEFRALLAALVPRSVFTSDLARRLRLQTSRSSR
ncbi:hypothetical protein ACFU8I_18700 [Streptomyces sp. NPDC057540]|uniref:hypothetical protein n=1 Tax=Streptomyces sp. NPDC057540 TaxID=3346160 RepID=UPI0036A2EF29